MSTGGIKRETERPPGEDQIVKMKRAFEEDSTLRSLLSSIYVPRLSTTPYVSREKGKRKEEEGKGSVPESRKKEVDIVVDMFYSYSSVSAEGKKKRSQGPCQVVREKGKRNGRKVKAPYCLSTGPSSPRTPGGEKRRKGSVGQTWMEKSPRIAKVRPTHTFTSAKHFDRKSRVRGSTKNSAGSHYPT